MANNVACEIMLINPSNENFNFVFNSLKELPILTDCSLSCGMSPWVRGSKFKVRSVVCIGTFADLLLVTNSSSLMIIAENRETKHTYRVQYTPIDLLLTVQDENIYYDLGKL
uniref:D-glucuronyl C5-epimerase beta-sandwich domain-containing protein n=1 Tax=Glossina palpalis gambiensis TaxID=67801 RepID=A0A1B0BUF0_9MUSC